MTSAVPLQRVPRRAGHGHALACPSSREGYRTRRVATEPVRGCRRSARAWIMGQAFELLLGQVRVRNGRLADPVSAVAGDPGDMTGGEVVRSSRSGADPAASRC